MIIDESCYELQDLLYRQIPITRHLQLRVRAYDGQMLCLDAPLAENVNHAGTAFGGSLSALLTLAGWSMVWFVLREYDLQGEILIQDSSCKYLKAVTSDFSACCHRPADAEIQRFVKMLRVHGKARLKLNAEIYEGDSEAVLLTGRYIVTKGVGVTVG